MSWNCTYPTIRWTVLPVRQMVIVNAGHGRCCRSQRRSYGFDGINHLEAPVDTSNPYFQFDSSKCIVCSRCVRACNEVQGTFALTIEGRGFNAKVSAGIGEDFLDSECVSCGACIQACPTATLMEKSIVDHGLPEHSVKTTCAYCGVGCSFIAEMRGDQVVRMTPDNDGQANHGHSRETFHWSRR